MTTSEIVELAEAGPELRRLIEAAGLALFGSRWQTDLAEALNVSDRTVRRWMAGDSAIPPSVAGEIRDLLDTRRTTLGMLIEAFADQATPAVSNEFS